MYKLIISIALCLISLNAHSFNLGFLKYAPASYMSEEDNQLFRSAVGDALNNMPGGAVKLWSNDKTKSKGKITTLKSFTKNNLPCRTLRIVTKAGGQQGKMVIDMCKKDSDWKVLSIKN